MTDVWHIVSTQSVTGFSLVQRDDTLYIMSPCCKARVQQVRISGGMDIQCTMCSTICHTRCVWADQVVIRYINNDSEKNWADWGKYWFGFEEFNMEENK